LILEGKMKDLTLHRTSTDLCSGIHDGETLLELARGWLKQGNPVVALELLQTAIASREADISPLLRAQVLKETGRAYMMQSDWDKADGYYLEAQRLFKENGNSKGAAESARNRANMLFQRGRYAESEDLCEQALEWASEINDYELRATILNTLGAIKSATGYLNEAVKVLRLCLADFESAGNKARQGYVLLNIGLTQTELNDFSEAIASLNGALAIALEIRDLNLVEICYQNISRCYLSQNETVLARSVCETARKILPGLNSKALETELCSIEGKISRLTGDLRTAESRLQAAYEQACRNNLQALQADLLLEQGLLYRDMGKNSLAVSKLNAAVDQFKSFGIEKGFKEAVQVLEQLNRKSQL
jgi:tetratricopeptide (TPR) repeat protein